MDEKITMTFYKHEEIKSDMLKYNSFGYLPIDRIEDAPYMTKLEYLAYVMVKYGTVYHDYLHKMKNNIPLHPITIYSKPNSKGIYRFDLFKYDKALLLCSYHMGYTHVPVLFRNDVNNVECDCVCKCICHN